MGKYVFTFALQPDIVQENHIPDLILSKLVKFGILSNDARLNDSYWQEIYLPRIYDSDLDLIKSNFPSYVEIFKTENFTRGISLNAERWYPILSKVDFY